MKLKRTLLALALVGLIGPAVAGDYVELPKVVYTSPGGVQFTEGVDGINSLFDDQLYLHKTASTMGTVGGVSIPTSISYNATEVGTFATIASGVLELVDFRYTPDMMLAGEKIGHLYDFVYRDTRDDKLVFGTRVTLGVEPDHINDAELNFLYRYGFQEGDTTFSAAAGWLFTSNRDLRMYNAARTDSDLLLGAMLYDADTIRFQSDVNLSEANPFSGLFLVKTDAEYYTLSDEAVGVFQAGEEGQPRVGATFAGFVPTAVNPVPEPSTYALMGLGLAGIAALARRRRNSSKA